MASQYDTRHTQTELSSPAVETLLGVYGPKLSGILGGNINTASFAPAVAAQNQAQQQACLLYTSPSPRDNTGSRMPSSA